MYETHRQGLFTLALAITRCPALAEDAIQEAFLRLWRTGARPDGDPVPYVFAAVRNAAVDQVRKSAAAGRPVPESIFGGEARDPSVSAATAEEHRAVREAVDALPDAQREVVVMKTYGGLTFEQIAQTTGEPLQTVASRYRRALERLGQRLGSVARTRP